MSLDWIKEIIMFLPSESNIGSLLLCGQNSATCKVSYSFCCFKHDGEALSIYGSTALCWALVAFSVS
jgi:hypothetical protein